MALQLPSFLRLYLAKVFIALSTAFAAGLEILGDAGRDELVLQHGFGPAISQWLKISVSFAVALSISGVATAVFFAPVLLLLIIFFVLTLASAFVRQLGWLQQRSESLLIWSTLPFGGFVFFLVGLWYAVRAAVRSIQKWCCRVWVKKGPKRLRGQDLSDHFIPLPLYRSLHPPAPFRLLDLPAELRANVYQASIDNVNALDCTPTQLLRPNRDFRHAIALFRTCRQIRHEAYHLFFSSHLFQIYTRYPFYRSIDGSMLRRIRQVNLVAHCNSLGYSGLYAVLKYDLPQMVQLRDLHITLSMEDFLKWQKLISGAFGQLRTSLPFLSYVALSVSMRTRRTNSSLHDALSICLEEAKAEWPPTCRKVVESNMLAGRPKRKVWHGSLTVRKYAPEKDLRFTSSHLCRKL